MTSTATARTTNKFFIYADKADGTRVYARLAGAKGVEWVPLASAGRWGQKFLATMILKAMKLNDRPEFGIEKIQV